MSLEQAVVQLEQTNAALQEEVVRFRDAAMGLNAVYPTITAGRQAVSDGAYFSVPGNGAYMRLYRRQGSSASLIAEYPDRASLDSVITQLGPLLGRGVVGGSGDLLAEFAYGINGNGHVVGFNETPGGCFFRSVTEGGNVNGEPSIASGTFSGFLSRGTNSNHAVQIGAYTAGGDGGAGHLYWRKRWQSGLTSYKKIYDVSNILGTVSQSDGAPTGAIIERGSNANGSYTKFADGTLICRKIILVTTTEPGTVGSENWTLPVTSLTKSLLSTAVITSSPQNFPSSYLSTDNNNYTIYVYNGAVINLGRTVEAIAIGSWY